MADDTDNQIVDPVVAVMGDSLGVDDSIPFEQTTDEEVFGADKELVDKVTEDTMQEMTDVTAKKSERTVIQQQNEHSEIYYSTAFEVDELKETASEPLDTITVDPVTEWAEVSVHTGDAYHVSLSYDQSEEI